MRALVAEAIGTFWLVFASLGTAFYAAGVADVGVGWLGVSLAFGLTIVTMAYAIGHISGCHLNPAVTIGLTIAGRAPAADAPGYIIAQIIGAILGASLLAIIGSGIEGFAVANGSNGYGEHSPGGYGLLAVLITEIVLTAVFLFVIMGATSSGAPAGFAPIAIGLCLTLIHLVSIPISNTSVNPARSIGTALVDGQAWSLIQLWAFIIAPIIGGVIGALAYKYVNDES
ncbi:MAG: aquaporin Z [Pseudomonadota bacterium]